MWRRKGPASPCRAPKLPPHQQLRTIRGCSSSSPTRWCAGGSGSPVAGRARALEVENALLRHQLAVLRRRVKRPWLRLRDRVLMTAASRLLPREHWSPPPGGTSIPPPPRTSSTGGTSRRVVPMQAGRGHYVHPDLGRVLVPGGRDRLLLPHGDRVVDARRPHHAGVKGAITRISSGGDLVLVDEPAEHVASTNECRPPRPDRRPASAFR